MLDYLLFFIGTSLIIELLYELIPLIHGLFGKADLSKYQGSWAIVTGSTDGIGLGLCHGFAKLGINIVQISRNPEKLARVASDLKAKYGIQVKNISRDFEICPQDPICFFQGIFKEIGDLNVKILVNNVGSESSGRFHKQSIKAILLQNACNIWPIVFMTKLFIARPNSCRKTDLIVNMSSISATFSLPYAAVYSAGKGFDKVFSNVLSEENFNVTCFQPSFIKTPMVSKYRKLILMIGVDEFVGSSLKQIGKVKNSYGHRTHYIAAFLLYFINDLKGVLIKFLK